MKNILISTSVLLLVACTEQSFQSTTTTTFSDGSGVVETITSHTSSSGRLPLTGELTIVGDKGAVHLSNRPNYQRPPEPNPNNCYQTVEHNGRSYLRLVPCQGVPKAWWR